MSINILIVDDSMTIRSMIIKALRLSVCDLGEVYEAENGISALARLSTNPVDVVLTDINMPRMDGLQLIQKIRSIPELADLPVIVVTTEGSRERLTQLEQYKVSGYLRKPFRPEQLREVLSNALEITHEHQSIGSDECDF